MLNETLVTWDSGAGRQRSAIISAISSRTSLLTVMKVSCFALTLHSSRSLRAVQGLTSFLSGLDLILMACCAWMSATNASQLNLTAMGAPRKDQAKQVRVANAIAVTVYFLTEAHASFCSRIANLSIFSC